MQGNCVICFISHTIGFKDLCFLAIFWSSQVKQIGYCRTRRYFTQSRALFTCYDYASQNPTLSTVLKCLIVVLSERNYMWLFHVNKASVHVTKKPWFLQSSFFMCIEAENPWVGLIDNKVILCFYSCQLPGMQRYDKGLGSLTCLSLLKVILGFLSTTMAVKVQGNGDEHRP